MPVQITQAPWPGLAAPQTSNIHTLYRQGAVGFSNGTFIRGPSANVQDFTSGFTKGVFSFWANYDSSASMNSNSAVIRLVGGSGAQPTNNQITGCANQNPQNETNSSGIPNATIGCIAIMLGPHSVNAYLVDNSTQLGLLNVSFPYVDESNATFNGYTFVNLGDFVSLLHLEPYTFNGNLYGVGTPGAYGIPPPCGGNEITGGLSGGTWRSAKYSSVSQMLADPVNQPPFLNALSGGTVGTQVQPPGSPTLFDSQMDLWVVVGNSSGGTALTGWHHYIFSFDTSQLVTDVNGAQCIRAQMAIDGAGGSIQGGALYDTKSTAPTAGSQPFPGTLEQSGVTGTLGLHTDDLWIIAAPSDAPVQFAYCYMGVADASASFGDNFYDLTVGANIRRFLTATGGPQSLGSAGISVPLVPVFMHTGGATAFSINAAETNRHKDTWEIPSGLLTSVPGP